MGDWIGGVLGGTARNDLIVIMKYDMPETPLDYVELRHDNA